MTGQFTLHQLDRGERGRIIGFRGGRKIVKRLNAMGLRAGKEITKVSNSFLGGPVTIRLDNSIIAVGNFLAYKIYVEVLSSR